MAAATKTWSAREREGEKEGEFKRIKNQHGFSRHVEESATEAAEPAPSLTRDQQARWRRGDVPAGALRSLLGLWALALCVDGADQWQQWPARGRGALAMRVLAAAAVQLQVADAGTPLFSSFFDRETCCLKPNFLNENVAPELMRCKQVRPACPRAIAAALIVH